MGDELTVGNVGSAQEPISNGRDPAGHRVLAGGVYQAVVQADILQLRCAVLVPGNNARRGRLVIIARPVIDDSGVVNMNIACPGK